MMFEQQQQYHEDEYFSKNLIETITLLCKNNVRHMNDLKIQGLIALTSDSTNFIVIPIDELITKNNNNFQQQSYHSHHDDSNSSSSNNNSSVGSMFPMMMNGGMNFQNVQRPPFVRAPQAGRGRGTPQRNSSVRMKIPNQFLTPNKAKAKQNLKFFTPQKKPPHPRLQPSSVPVQKRAQRVDYMQDIETTDNESRPMSANSHPPQKRRLVPVKQELNAEESTENQQQQSNLRSSRANNNYARPGDVFVLSDEETDYRPVRIKSEFTINNNRRVANEIIDADVVHSNLEDIVQDSLTACQTRMPALRYIKEEPTITIENLKSELPDNTYDHQQYQASTSQQQQQQQQPKQCLECGEVYSNLRALRQHMRQTHLSSTGCSNSSSNNTTSCSSSSSAAINSSNNMMIVANDDVVTQITVGEVVSTND